MEQRKHLIILGTASTLPMTPWDKPDTDYWICGAGIGNPAVKGHRIDASIEVHPMETWLSFKDEYNKRPEMVVYMQEHVALIPGSVKYPLKEIQDMVKDIKGLGKTLTSSIGLLIALAVYKDYKDIEFYGVHMAHEEEIYSEQREGCVAWLMYFAGRGGRYWMPDQSAIMAPQPIYGYEQEKGIILKLMHEKEGLELGKQNLEAELIKAKEKLDYQKGAFYEVESLIKKLRV
jgi:hypothetical protein